MLSSAVTKFSKKRQVRRAINRSAVASAAVSGFARSSVGGKLVQRATSGDSIQRTTNGTAISAPP